MAAAAVTAAVTISAVLSRPYLMRGGAGFDDAQYEGFVVDLANAMSAKFNNSTYKIILPPDGRYGSKNAETGNWNGMLGEVFDGRADLAIADLTITPQRLQDFHFSMPFMESGIGILYTKAPSPSFQPYLPITSAEDLAAQSAIAYGSFYGGSTARFFANSEEPAIQKMWRVMQQNREDVMTTSNAEGVAKVLASKGGYAFFMELPSLDYAVRHDCALQKVGDTFNSVSYGIAMRRGFPPRSNISEAVIQLRMDGTVKRLRDKWWNRGAVVCDVGPIDVAVNPNRAQEIEQILKFEQLRQDIIKVRRENSVPRFGIPKFKAESSNDDLEAFLLSGNLN